MKSPDKRDSYDIFLINEDIEKKSGIRIIDEVLFCNPNQKVLVMTNNEKDITSHNVSIIVKPFSMYDFVQKIGKITAKMENPYLNI